MPIDQTAVIHDTTKVWHPELVNLYGCTIGANCSIGSFVEIGKGVIIGNNCKIQSYVFIPTMITIGDGVFIGPGVKFTNDKYPPSHGAHWRPVVVEDHVSIGGGAVILPGITLGHHCQIGAGAVVTRDVAPATKVKGLPARLYLVE